MAPGWTIAPDRMTRWLTGPSGWAIHYPEAARPKRSYGMTAGGVLQAAAQVTLYPRAGDGGVLHVDASIGWIAADGEPGAIADFIGRIEADVRAAGATEIGCFSRNELGIGWFGLPESRPSMAGGFAAAGYAPAETWTLLTTDVSTIPKCPPPGYSGLTLDVFDRPDDAEHEWIARIKGADAAECLVWHPPAVFSAAPDFTEWTTLEVVEVQSPFRRQGLARWLLGEVAARLASRGFRKLAAWTETSNAPALAWLSTLGFRPAATSRCVTKPLR